MEYVWTFSNTAVTVCPVDFLDPAVADQPHARERGVRLEVRPVRWQPAGSIYASSALRLEPAVVRVDLLESSPRAADRMHWHPGMRDGEPRARTFDGTMPDDPRGWLEGFFADLCDAAVEGLEPDVANSLHTDSMALASSASDIVDRAIQVLEDSRSPWPQVTHDGRGMATL